MFIDAAAFVAILTDEPEGARCAEALETAETRSSSPIAVWEAAVAISGVRKLGIPLTEAEKVIRRFMDERGIELVDLPPADISTSLAVHAMERFGSGKRRLNLADCFHYACAKHYGVPILSTDDEFRLTDLDVVA